MAQSFKASSLKGGYARNAGKRWRGGDVAELRALINRGASLRIISLKLGRPDSAIRAKANALGLSIEADTPEPAARPATPRPDWRRAEPVRAERPRQLELFG